MAQSKVYVDTNVYLRLAQSIHPLLFQSFCPQEYTLYITHRFQQEYDRQPRLREKFYWVNQPMYAENRTQRINISREQTKDIVIALGFISDYNLAHAIGVQDVDIDILAHALVMELPVTTDDRDMTNLATTFNVEIWDSITLMKTMHDCEHVTIAQLDAAVEYMAYMEDLPRPRYIRDYVKAFPASKLKK